MPMQNTKGWQAVLVGGGIAGTLDITYACVRGVVLGSTAQRILQSVASGWLGRDAFTGGWATAGLGLASHFMNALLIATVYYAASRKVALLTQQAALCGLAYGAVVYVVMSRVVVPLSAAPFEIPLRWLDLGVHMVFIGLPIALAVSRTVKE